MVLPRCTMPSSGRPPSPRALTLLCCLQAQMGMCTHPQPRPRCSRREACFARLLPFASHWLTCLPSSCRSRIPRAELADLAQGMIWPAGRYAGTPGRLAAAAARHNSAATIPLSQVLCLVSQCLQAVSGSEEPDSCLLRLGLTRSGWRLSPRAGDPEGCKHHRV